MSEPRVEAPPSETPHIRQYGYEIWYYPPVDGIVPDIIVANREDEDHIKLWIFQGTGPLCQYTLHTQHDHTKGGVCKKWSRYDDSFPELEEEHNPPEEVQEIVMRLSDAPCVFVSDGD